MSIDISKLIDKSPKQLSEIKKNLLSVFNFEDANEVQEYIEHCINTSRLIKSIIRG